MNDVAIVDVDNEGAELSYVGSQDKDVVSAVIEAYKQWATTQPTPSCKRGLRAPPN